MKRGFFTIILLTLTHCAVVAQWVRLSSQISGPIASVGNILLLSDEAMFRSSDFGNTWDTVNGMPNLVCEWRFILANKNDAYLTTDYCGFFYSKDSGQTWKNGQIGYSLLAQPTSVGDTLYMDVVDDGLWESGDQGLTWSSMKNRETNCHFGGDTSAYCWTLDSNYLFAGGTPFGGVYRSPDSAVTWNQVLPLSYDTGIYAITAHGRFILAGAYVPYGSHNVGMYRSTDWGTTWQLDNNGLAPGRIAALTTIGSTIFAGGDFGVFISQDDGAHWVNANPDSTMGTIYSFATLGPYLFASGGGSTWRRHLSDFGISSVAQVALKDNPLNSYPNPFSQSTTISFQPQASGYAEISIINLLGTEVANLFSGELDATEHHFIWNPEGVPDGMYECRVRMNGHVDALPVVLQR